MTSNTSKILMEEHQNILTVVGALEKECRDLGAGGDLNQKFFYKTIDFIRNYADALHHAKEEDILFKELKGKLDGPVAQMLYEHELGRGYTQGLEVAVNNSNSSGILQNSCSYINLILGHIEKEDTVLYPMADKVLGEEVKNSMLERFMQVAKVKAKELKEYTEVIAEYSR